MIDLGKEYTYRYVDPKELQKVILDYYGVAYDVSKCCIDEQIFHFDVKRNLYPDQQRALDEWKMGNLSYWSYDTLPAILKDLINNDVIPPCEYHMETI